MQRSAHVLTMDQTNPCIGMFANLCCSVLQAPLRGISPVDAAHEAWEMVRERYLFPPEEQGASPEESPSPGLAAMRDLTQTLGALGMEPDPIRKN